MFDETSFHVRVGVRAFGWVFFAMVYSNWKFFGKVLSFEALEM